MFRARYGGPTPGPALSTHVLSRSFIRDEPAFQAWARQRLRSDIQPLGSALRAAI